MRRVAADIVANVAANTTANAVGELIKTLCACTTLAGITAIVGSTSMAVLIPAVALVGAQLLIRRGERQDEAAFDAHCDEVRGKLEDLAANVEGSADQLADLVEHRTWVWARISGGDQAAFARRVAGEVFKRMSELGVATDEKIDGLLVYGETVLFRLERVETKLDDVVRLIVEKYDRTDAEHRQTIEEKKKEIASLTASLQEAQRAAETGDVAAERAIRLARLTADAELLQKTIARLADERHASEQAKFVERCREVVAIAYLRGDIDEALSRAQTILAIDPDDLEAINRLGLIYLLRGNVSAAESQFRHLLDFKLKPVTRAAVLVNLGEVARTRGDIDAAERYYDESLAVARTLESLELQATNLGNLGLIARIRGDSEIAERRHNEALTYARTLESLELQATNLGNLGIIAQNRGDLDAAERFHIAALDIARKLGKLTSQANQLGNLGILARTRGDLDAAERFHNDSLMIARKLGSVELQAINLGNLGVIAQSRGDLDAAERFHNDAIAIARTLGKLETQAVQLGNLGVIARNRGDLDAAQRFFNESLAMARAFGSVELQASSLGNLGELAKQQGRFEEARQLFTQSHDLFSRIGMQQKAMELQSSLDQLPPSCGPAENRASGDGEMF